MHTPLDEAVTTCRSLDDFHALMSAHGVLAAEPRFMHLELDITNKCNLRCVMCYHSFEATRRLPTVNMAPEDFGAIADAVLPRAGRLSLSLGNEPLMSPHFIPVLRLAAKHRVPEVNFFTNGFLLDEAKIEAIIECGVTQVCVSLDGATAPTYNAIRRNSDFDRVVGNVARLIARRNELGSRTPRVRFDFVMMQRNVHEAEAIVHLASRLGVQEMNFCHLVSYEGLDMEGESLKHTKALCNYWLLRALDAANRAGIPVPFHPQLFDLELPKEPDRIAADVPVPAPPADSPAVQGPFDPTPYCPYPFFHVSVGPGGHVLPRPFSHGEEPYGRLTADGDTIETIWLGPAFTTLRQRILRHDPPDMCRRCAFLSNRFPNAAHLFAVRQAAPGDASTRR